MNGHISHFELYFCNYYLAAPLQILGHYRGDRVTHPILVTVLYLLRPERHRKPRDEAGSLSPAKSLPGWNREPSNYSRNALTR